MRRFRWLAPLLLVVIWFGLGGIGGPTFGKLESISSNDQSTFLPQSADSTRARDWQARFSDAKAIPAIVILEADRALTPEQLGQFTELAQRLGRVDGVQLPAGGRPAVIGPVPSQDGRAAQIIVPVERSGEARKIVPELRSIVADSLPAGVRGYVSGPAGLLADLVKAFGGIDGILLLVAVSAVFVILVVVYRSIILPFLVLLTAIFALCAAILAIYWMGKAGWITLNGQSQGILSILVIGAATDYALLLVARFREALGHMTSRWEALWQALRVSFEPITASAATVALALLCLLVSDLGSNRGLGPVAATGIAFAWLAAVTFLPAMLALFGRTAFWPYRPQVHQAPANNRHDVAVGLDGLTPFWHRLGRLIASRPRATWAITAAVLAIMAGGLLQLKAEGVSQTDIILSRSESVEGQEALARHFDAGSGSPAVIIVDQARFEEVRRAAAETSGVSTAVVYSPAAGFPGAPAAPKVVDGKVLINATLQPAADSPQAEDIILALRERLSRIDQGVLVGGTTAIQLDTQTTARHDLIKIIPVVLVVILVILMILLRSVLAPVLLVGTVVLSYAATLGLSAVVFNHIFHFPGADPTVPLFGFVFLVALGIDYNIFLMTRVREESIERGTRAGILHGLGKTGGVITSAGIVLAATFAALGVLPILFLVQLAFIVAVGVLLDTALVRSLLVPALSYHVGRSIWWPSKLARAQD